VLEQLVANPLRTADMSEAALFRSLADEQATLLLDEIDAIFGGKTRDREGLRGLLNAGHRAGATVRRVVGEGANMRVESFPVFCAKALAGIGELPDTVTDRAIPIRLKRAMRTEKVERWRRREQETPAASLRDRAARFALQHIDELSEAKPNLPEQLGDRAADGWEPLFAIGDRAGAHWGQTGAGGCARALHRRGAGRRITHDPSTR
jgi:uncharacterized protein DUF3631